jgi:SAM-dependent methyltransferase
MHANSLEIVKNFVTQYFPDKKLRILDLGSRVIPRQEHLGSYRQFMTNGKWTYIGADIEKGINVDKVIQNYKFPYKDKTFDFVISGQTIEHLEYPWVWFKEVTRVLKPGGLCCIVAPAVIHEHKYPIDTYRYYPDGMMALAKWSGLEVIEAQKIVVNYKMEDTYLIARKIGKVKNG